VIHQRQRPIPGLYASGNAAAATEQGIGYQAGMSLAASMTFSYLAVRHMIDEG
jgi:3-oxosteroid 1-dehydrogenase